MDRFAITSADGSASIEFADREPPDRSRTLDYFTVRVRDVHLDAAARVYAFMCVGLPELFSHIAHNGASFTGPRGWSSLEGEFALTVSHDGLGHFAIAAELKSGPYPGDWIVRSSVVVETAQLDRIPTEMISFLGKHE